MSKTNGTIATIKKLQKAINSKGQKVLFCSSQFYSDDQDRVIQKYHIKQQVWDIENQKNKQVELFSSCSQIQICLFMRDMWYTLIRNPLPQDNEKWNGIRATIPYFSEEDIEDEEQG